MGSNWVLGGGGGGWIFNGDKNPKHDLLRGEVKPVLPFCKILQHVKDPYSMKEICEGKIHGHFS
jgi:hypothetical protein